ncbi:MAG TPA: hypothetical protein PLU18_08645 [Ferruginibacter sp.]|nr:hypothetical protein [Ferruginibacter sp.]HRC03183.1 hypothetical protein [Niabella sp.]
MQKLIISIGTLAALLLLTGLYALIMQPYQSGTNTRLFAAGLISGLIVTVIFLLLTKYSPVKAKKLKCNNRPKLSKITVEIYGDEKVLIIDNKIINL